MFRKNVVAFWITLFFFVMAIPAYSEMLDGKEFVGKSGRLGKGASDDDQIKFENGKFTSTGCTEYGFGDADYTTKVDGDRIFFTADIYSDKYGRITYSGFVKGNDMSANYIWWDRGKYENPEQIKWFKGSTKK
jgi:hypothetical protein